jgi:hypothetical protein
VDDDKGDVYFCINEESTSASTCRVSTTTATIESASTAEQWEFKL